MVVVQALDDEEVFLNIDLIHLHQYDKQLYGQLVAYPGEVIPLLDAEARYIAEDLLGGEELPEEKLLTVLCTIQLEALLLLLLHSECSEQYTEFYFCIVIRSQ